MSALNFYSNLLGNKVSQLRNFLLHKTGNAVTDVTVEAQIAYSTSTKRINYHDGTAVRELVDKTYIDALAATGTAPPLPFDASVETAFPSTNAKYVVTVAGTVQGVSLEVQDQLFPKTATPTAVAADWWILQGNLDKATQADVDGGSDNNKYITPLTVKNRYISRSANDPIVDNPFSVSSINAGDTAASVISLASFGARLEKKTDTRRSLIELEDNVAKITTNDSTNSTGTKVVQLSMTAGFEYGSFFNPATSSMVSSMPAFANVPTGGFITKKHLEDYFGAEVGSKKFKTTMSLTAGMPSPINHNMGLADATDLQITAWHNGSQISVDISAVNGNTVAVFSEVSLSDVKFVLVGV